MKLGQVLIELIVAMGMLAIFLPALLTGLVSSSSGKVQQTNRQEASLLVQEELETLDVIRNAGWTAFATDGVFHTESDGTTWTKVAGSEAVSIFTRQVEIFPVNRLNGDIVESGGTPDPSTKKVVITVSWATPLPSSVSVTRYFTRYQDNLEYKETLKTEFDTGTKNGVATELTSGSPLPGDGQVVLSGGGHGDWCKPNLTIQSFSYSGNGKPLALSAIEGRVFIGSGKTASSNTFYNVAVSNPPYPTPITTSLAGSYTASQGSPKANSVFGDQNYAYIALQNNNKELDIVRLSNYTEVGVYDAPGNIQNNSSIFVSGTTGYLTQDNVLRVINLTNIAAPSTLGSLTLTGSPGTGNKVITVGNYAYVAVDSATEQLQIIDVTNPASPAKVGWATVTGLGGTSLAVNATGTRVFLTTKSSASQPELYVFDVTNKTGSHTQISSYDTNGMNPSSVAIATNNKVIIVGKLGEEYQVVDFSTETSPIHCGGLDTDPSDSTSGIYRVAVVREADGDAYSYIGTDITDKELQIIEGGPNGSAAGSGIFTSQYIPGIAYSTAFNRLTWTFTKPNQNTSIQLQVAGAEPGSQGCLNANYVFVGPDGTAGTYFTGNGQIPLNYDGANYENPAQCFKYRVYLDSTDPGSTPIFSDITIGYSP